MTSASDAMSVATIETNMETWRPSDVHHLVPTLVLMCGAMTVKDAISIQVNVQERLGSNVPANAVRWERIKSEEDASEERIKRLLAPFLKLEYVEDLSAGGFLDIPSKDQLLDLQIVVVYDLTGQDEADASRLLQGLETALGKLVSKGAEASLMLLVIGEGEPDLGQETTYWPRFRLQSRTYSGLVADRERILEVCQDLIVALITSELVRAIDHKVGPDKGSTGWIWIGASALVVDLVGMREFVRQSIFYELVHPMIKAQLTADVGHQIEVRMQDQVQALQAKNLASAMDIVSDYGWFAEGEEGTRRITRMDLRPQDELTVKIFEPGSNLSADLSERYRVSRRSLIEHLGERAAEEFNKLRASFAFRMDPRPEDYHILGSTRRVDAQDTSLSLEEPLFPGLAAATFAVEKASEYMTKSPDIHYPGLSPHPVGSDYYLTATAKLDANVIHGGYRRCRRYEKTMLSPQGFFLKLVPAWPFLTAMILVLTDWEKLLAGLVAASLLSGLGIVQFISLRRSLANLWKRVRSNIQRTVRLSVLGVIANLLQGYRILVAGQLTEMAFNLRNLRSLLAWEDAKSLRRIAESKAKSDVPFKGQTTVYWLADWDKCRDWVRKAIASAAPRDFYSSITEIIVKSVVGGDGQPTAESGKPEQSYQFVYNEIERWVEQLTQGVFHPPELKAHTLAGKESPLEDGSGSMRKQSR